MSDFERGQRVNRKGDPVLGEDPVDGTGTVVKVSNGTVAVSWDQYSRGLLIREDPRDLVLVTPHCSYAKEQWARGRKWGITGMVIVCDVHGFPGRGDVYEIEDATQAKDRCTRFPEV